jgi:pilus assembly protein CpaE
MSSMISTPTQENDTLGGKVMSVALIGPDDSRRGSVALSLAGAHSGYTREFVTYPELDDVPQLLQQNHDVIIIDLDPNPEYALDLIESICGSSSATVMAFSGKSDSELLVRCMRAGAREFLTQPIAQSTMAEAMVRASVRRPQARSATPKKVGGKLLVFIGAKGGAGATTLACNFAVSVARESGQNTLLIDLDLPLGDAALGLGADSEYSTINALENWNRLDNNFLSKLLVKHSSGLQVLGAPGKHVPYPVTNEALDKLLAVARQDFDYVIVDAGSKLDFSDSVLLDKATTIYLVSQVSIPALRNANRLITQVIKGDSSRVEIVINRATGRYLDIDEEHITKALTKAPRWKVPNDYPAAHKNQNSATPLTLEDTPVSRAIRQMALAVTGAKPKSEKKLFSFFPAKRKK